MQDIYLGMHPRLTPIGNSVISDGMHGWHLREPANPNMKTAGPGADVSLKGYSRLKEFVKDNSLLP